MGTNRAYFSTGQLQRMVALARTAEDELASEADMCPAVKLIVFMSRLVM